MNLRYFSQLCGYHWIAFCIHITQYINEPNINLQGANDLVYVTFDKIMAYERKLRLWELELRSYSITRFPILRTEKLIGAKKYAAEIHLEQEFNSRFQDNAGMRPRSTYFQCHLALMLKLFQPNFRCRWYICSVTQTWEIHTSVFDSCTFINSVPAGKFPVLSDHARRMTSFSGARIFANSSFPKWKWSVNLEIDSATKDWKSISELLLLTYTCVRRDIENMMAKLLSDVFHRQTKTACPEKLYNIIHCINSNNCCCLKSIWNVAEKYYFHYY
jgi:hypothetical protein